MRHAVAGRKLGRPTSHRLSMYRNLVTDVLRHEKVKTTEAKAKEVQALVEKMITLGKNGSLHARRQALSYMFDPQVVEKLFDVLAKRYADRKGGYTRVVSIGTRLGDAAPVAVIELVD
ncbi:MAG: 50S ribosomal protein L17 [Chloroflexi bacterium]|nr:50S ribosomal protein L17 [Chloroflexota bacterium]